MKPPQAADPSEPASAGPAVLLGFVCALRAAGVPVSVGEYLMLLQALAAGVAGPRSEDAWSLEDLYHLSRTSCVKDERHYDRFDRTFSAYFGQAADASGQPAAVPQAWLQDGALRDFSESEKAALAALDWDQLLRTLADRLRQQRERHAGGSHWIGTGGTSPFGAGGFNPRGIRIGQEKSRQQAAVKIWEQRAYQDYDDEQALGSRNLQMALRRLRRFAREGAQQELDLPGTLAATAANAGWLALRQMPERHNRVKVLLLMDVGGSMDEHVRRVEELFGAAKSEFKHLVFYYFHNCVYDFLWKNNRRRFSEKFDTWDVIRTYNKDYKLIFVGDATMSPYEILQPGGSVEYANEEAGAQWLERLARAFPKHVWINPAPPAVWPYRQSVALVQQLLGGQMFALTPKGLEEAMRRLSR